MGDRLLRMVDSDLKMRIFAAQTTNVVEAARTTHGLSPVASAALGRTLTGALMMGMMLKNTDDRLTVQVKGDGPLGGIVAVSNHKGKVKGYVFNNNVYLEPNSKGKLDVGGAVGKNGYVNVIKDIGLKKPYIGFVPLVSGEIGEDLSAYFLKSEQVPSVVALGVLVNKTTEILTAGGIIIQLLPEAGENLIDTIEQNLNKFSSITNYLSQGEELEDVVKRMTGNLKLKVLEEIEPEFSCDCSAERMQGALVSLGRKELEGIIETQGQVEIQCHFCLKKHTFDKNSVEKMFKD